MNRKNSCLKKFIIRSMGLVAASLIGLGCPQPVHMDTPPTPIQVAQVNKTSVPLEIQAVGTVEPLQTVAIRAQVSGILVGVEFEEGQDVKAGQVLFRIDPKPYLVALQQAEATLERDRIQAANSEREANRYKALVEKDFVTQEQYEKLRATADAYRGTLAVDQASLERVKLDLGYCTIRTPINGRSGGLVVKAGNLIRANDTLPLVVVNQIDPILVKFSIPENQLASLQKYLGKQSLEVKAIWDPTSPPLSGTLNFVDNAVDPTTGTIALKARFSNPGNLLWPGRFVEVTVRLDMQSDALVVPSQAIQTGQQGSFVFVVKEDQTVEMRPVKTSRGVDGKAIIETGLKDGEQVVVDGQLRLTTGTRVKVKSATEPVKENLE